MLTPNILDSLRFILSWCSSILLLQLEELYVIIVAILAFKLLNPQQNDYKKTDQKEHPCVLRGCYLTRTWTIVNLSNCSGSTHILTRNGALRNSGKATVLSWESAQYSNITYNTTQSKTHGRQTRKMKGLYIQKENHLENVDFQKEWAHACLQMSHCMPTGFHYTANFWK